MIRLCESVPPTECSKFSTVNGTASARSATQETLIRQTIYFSAPLNYLTSSPVSASTFPIFDAVADVLVDLVKADLLPLRRGREQGYPTGHERQLEALPGRARCHDLLQNKTVDSTSLGRLRSLDTLSIQIFPQGWDVRRCSVQEAPMFST
jgi:hypothetical protein